MPITTPPVYATGVLTSSGVFTDTQTVVVGLKTYTTQTVLTNVDGNVAIGANAAATLQNLMDAINLTGTPGTQYAAAMTKNSGVRALSVTATVLNLQAKVAGASGNLLATTETQTNAAYGAATLTGGTGDPGQAVADILSTEQPNSSIAQLLRQTF